MVGRRTLSPGVVAETLDILYFVVLVGVLVFVHELGHFAVAKLFGVRVLTFSLGFGPRLLGIRLGDTEYRVAAFPLGGYVQMLGESSQDLVPGADEGQAFSSQPFWKRVLIILAGPAMNLAFPLLLFFIAHLGDGPVQPSVVGIVLPERPAAGVLEPGDSIEAVDGRPVSTFEQVMHHVAEHPDEPVRLSLLRAGETHEVTVTPVRTRRRREPLELELYEEVGVIGIGPMHPAAVVGVVPGGPAEAARMRTFDLVVAVGGQGQPVRRFLDLRRVLEANRGTTTQLTYLRPTRLPRALDGLVEIDVFDPHVAQVTLETGEGSGLERAGLESANLYVSHVAVDSPEYRDLQILPGDRLLELDGRPIRLFETFLRDLKTGRGEGHRLRWRRGSREFEAAYHLKRVRGETRYGQPFERYEVGIRNWVPATYNEPIPPPGAVWRAAARSLSTTAELVEVTVISVFRLLEGRLSYRTIGGLISIFEVTGDTRRESSLDFLRLMGLVSVNLGLINLLPIPVLDGGHLAIFSLEAMMRRRLPVGLRRLASLVGLCILLVLMVLAFKNDLERTWAEPEVRVEDPQ